MSSIADRAQVSKRKDYNHFPSKDDLLRAIVADVWTRAHAATDIPFRSEVRLEDQLAEIDWVIAPAIEIFLSAYGT